MCQKRPKRRDLEVCVIWRHQFNCKALTEVSLTVAVKGVNYMSRLNGLEARLLLASFGISLCSALIFITEDNICDDTH